jgi:hypothetical protein
VRRVARIDATRSKTALAADQGVDLGVFRKSAELFLGEGEPAIDGDLEHTGHSFDELDLVCAPLQQACPRTEGPWFIVSGHAIFDSDLHRRHL